MVYILIGRRCSAFITTSLRAFDARARNLNREMKFIARTHADGGGHDDPNSVHPFSAFLLLLSHRRQAFSFRTVVFTRHCYRKL